DPGSSEQVIKDSGYVPEQTVIDLAQAAGFKPDGKSDVNANPKDDHKHEGGVWALPPVLRNGAKDKDKYLAIGESDRMTLKFTKPYTSRALFFLIASSRTPSKRGTLATIRPSRTQNVSPDPEGTASSVDTAASSSVSTMTSGGANGSAARIVVSWR